MITADEGQNREEMEKCENNSVGTGNRVLTAVEQADWGGGGWCLWGGCSRCKRG